MAEGATMMEQTLAALGVLACVLMLARMALKPNRRARLDARVKAWWRGVKVWRPQRQAPPLPEDAAQATEELIRRASQAGRVDRQGNVYRPEKFGKPPKKPH